jgi:hypothetical protein
MSEPAEITPEARKEASRKHRERAINNLESALSYLRLPDDQIDDEQRAWAALVGITAASYAICQIRVTLVVSEEGKEPKLGSETPDNAFLGSAKVM